MLQNVPGVSTQAARQTRDGLIDALSDCGFADAGRLAEIVDEAGFADVCFLVHLSQSSGFTSPRFWSTSLCRNHADEGGLQVQEDIFASDRVAETRQAYSQTIMGAVVGMMKMLAARETAAGGTSEWESQSKRELYEAMLRELEGGKAYWRANLRVVGGRKAG